MKKALFYRVEDDKIKCELCPHNCLISNGKRGICKVRYNQDNVLYSSVYDSVSSIQLDPIEKKPLYHFYPGKNIVSIGTIGCNMKCSFCQNCDISQLVDSFQYSQRYSVSEVLHTAHKQEKNIGIAFTYNEPVIYYEFMYDIAIEAKETNLKTVMVTNGYINEKPLLNLVEVIDAFNIDLKAFNNQFYRKHTKSELNPVISTLLLLKKKKKHVEITNLVIPTLNDEPDEFEKMVCWIGSELGEDTVLHISRYFPRYKLNIESTSMHKLMEFYSIAKQYLNYVYIGNISSKDVNNTSCKKCKKEVIKREFYATYISGLDAAGCCKHCGEKILNFI
ncbi:AmmeMemoRadiSam system radical SAM enzyme [Bacteroidota bacterium]